MALPKPFTWPSSGGIDSKIAPFTLAPGNHLFLDNVRQERANEWRTRSGFTHNTADDLPGGNVPVLLTDTTPWGGMVGLVRQTTHGTAGRVFSPQGGARWITPPNDPLFGQAACAQQTPGVWSKRPVGPMPLPVSGFYTPAMVTTAEGGSYRLTASWTLGPGFNTGIQVALQTADGTTVQSFIAYNSDGAACRPRCVYSVAADRLVLVYQDGANAIVAHRWNASTGAFIGSTTLSANGYAGAPQAAYVDARDYGGATITVAFRNNTAAGQLQMVEFNPATAAIPFNVNTGLDCSNTLSLFPDPDSSGIRMVGICNAVPETRVIRISNTGAVQTNQLVEAVLSLAITGCAYNAGVDWMCVYNPTLYNLRAVKRRAGVTSGVVNLVPANRMRCTITAGAWREIGTDPMRYMIKADGFQALDAQPTYLEMAIEFENASANITNLWTEPQARLLTLNAGNGLVVGCVTQTQRLGADLFAVPLSRITRNISAQAAVGQAFEFDAWTVQYLNSTTYTGQNIGKGTATATTGFMPAGTLLHTATGQLLCSHGASAIPFQPVLTASIGAGTLNPAKTYVYGVNVIMPDDAGNDWRSPISLTASLMPGGANNTITIDIKLTPLENQQRKRTIQIWRTDGDGSALKLLFVVQGTVAQTGTFSLVDIYPDAIAGEPFTGEVQTGLTPAFSHVAIWNDRLWGVDRDFPTLIWFTKPLNPGLLPEFVRDPNTGVRFAVDIDDAYGDVLGIVALDDKLVVFKRNATYVLSGDGPDNSGNGSFPSFSRISSTVGTLPGSPFLSTGSEVYFVAPNGLNSVTNGQQVDFIGAPIDLYLSMPLLESPETVFGMVMSPGKNEVRIQTTGYRFVHDRTFNQWIRDTGGMIGDAEIKLTRMIGVGGRVQITINSLGELWREAADANVVDDAGIPYKGLIRTAWVKPANVDGWVQLFRARALGAVTSVAATDDPTLTVFYDYSENYSEAFKPPVPVGSATGPLRAEAQVRQQRCTAFSLQLELPTDSTIVRLDAWSATARVIPAAQALPLIKKWRKIIVPPAGPPLDAMLFWFKSDAGVTMDGSSRVSFWADQSGNALHMAAVDANGFALPASAWPVFTPTIANGLAGLKWVPGSGTNLNHVYPGGTFNQPTADDEPLMVLALVRPLSRAGGNIVTFRMNNADLELGMRVKNFGGVDYQIPMSTAQDTHATAMGTGHTPIVVDYTAQNIIIGWNFFGSTHAPQGRVRVNGVDRPFIEDSTGVLQAYTGVSGYSLGFTNAVFNTNWDGYIIETIGYRGNNPVTFARCMAYLRARGGV